jgi:antitoxin CptB
MENSLTVNQEQLARLKWRCRRGLLENDLLIEAFFTKHGARLSQAQLTGLEKLMDLSDPDLLDLLLNRAEPQGDLCAPEVLTVLNQLRKPHAATTIAV